MMTDSIMKHFHFEGQMILPLKVMQFCLRALAAFSVCLDSLGNETLEHINLSLKSVLLYSPFSFVDRQWHSHLNL